MTDNKSEHLLESDARKIELLEKNNQLLQELIGLLKNKEFVINGGVFSRCFNGVKRPEDFAAAFEKALNSCPSSADRILQTFRQLESEPKR